MDFLPCFPSGFKYPNPLARSKLQGTSVIHVNQLFRLPLFCNVNQQARSGSRGLYFFDLTCEEEDYTIMQIRILLHVLIFGAQALEV